MSKMNRIANADNKFQDVHKRVLCVCSAGLLRSPTTAVVLSQSPYNYNTRAAGIAEEYALIPVDDVLLHWAQEIVCMEKWHATAIGHMLDGLKLDTPVVILNVADNYMYRDPKLMKEIKESYAQSRKQ